jgi:peptidoglycan/LPS O-acetylase OafA/YrhL
MSGAGNGKIPASAPGSKLRLHGVDALRGIAASAIVIHHIIGINQIQLPSYLAFVPNYFGYGVPLFFVVSAFSLYYTYIDRMEGRQDICDYMVRRFARIAPLFYFMTAAWYATYHFVFGQWLTFGNVASNLTFTFNFVPAYQNGIVWAGWSIGTEYAFYFFLPLLISLVRSQLASLFLLVLAFLAEIGYQFSQNPIDDAASILTQMPFFTLGIITYFAFRRFSRWTPEARRALSIALLTVAVLLIAGITMDGPFRRLMLGGIRRTEFYTWGLPFACLVLSQAIYPLGILVNRMTRFLGAISYSLYLVHPLLIRLCQPMYLYIQISQRSVEIYLLWVTIATFVILVPVSWVTYRLIEVPGMDWGKRKSRRTRTVPIPTESAVIAAS